MEQRQDEAKPRPEDQAPAIPEKHGQRYPNLGSRLDGLAVQAEDGQLSVGDAAEGAAMSQGGTVAVTIQLSGSVDEVVRFLEENGGDPRHAGLDYVEGYVPVTLLGRLSQQAGVIRVREIVAAQPDQSLSGVAGHGSAVHGSAPWNRAGYTGQGVKVGVIDGGFRGMSFLMGTDLPATVVARCYTAIGVFTHNLADCEAVGDATVGIPFPQCGDAVQRRAVNNAFHGTLVAEPIIDIAPGASLYIANPRSWADMQDVVEWMASEGVAVINQSQSWLLEGPGDGTSRSGTSPLRTVDLAVAGGITWVNSAGNGARNTWFGGYADPDGNRAISFAGGLNDEVLDLPVRACRSYTVQLRWEDSWDGASSDLDLYLYDKRSGRLIFSISSEDEQSGAPGHEPIERLSFWSRADSNELGLVVFHHGGDAPDWIQLVVWGTSFIEHYTRSGSIGNPAESANPGLLAVGAAHWDDVLAIEPYSSRGPSPDGRIKPDVVGADCGATARVRLDAFSQGFCGTSQAAPRVAGMAALVHQRFPAYTPTQVAGYLQDTAQQRQSPDPNNTWGHGFVKLPPPDGSATTPPAPDGAFVRKPAADFDVLTRAFNRAPQGIWSDGVTMWVADLLEDKLYAYDMETKARVPGADYVSLRAARNGWPRGIWSDGRTMWVADSWAEKVYAYDVATRSRVVDREFNTLEAAGNWEPRGIWSDGTTMWVADWFDEEIYAYSFGLKNRAPAFPAGETGDRSVAENTAAGGNIGAPVRADEADGDALTYALGGTDAASFDIDSAAGQLLTKAALNHEGQSAYSVTVTATDPDGLSDDIAVTITVTDVNEAPEVSGSAPTTLDYAENRTDPVATYTATDPERDTLTWSLSGADAGDFDISTGGELTFKASPDFESPADADTDNVYAVTLTVADPGGLTDTQDVDVTVTDVDETGAAQTLLERYDADNSGSIEESEVITAINDYLDGGPNAPTRAQVIEVINLYLDG